MPPRIAPPHITAVEADALARADVAASAARADGPEVYWAARKAIEDDMILGLCDEGMAIRRRSALGPPPPVFTAPEPAPYYAPPMFAAGSATIEHIVEHGFPEVLRRFLADNPDFPGREAVLSLLGVNKDAIGDAFKAGVRVITEDIRLSGTTADHNQIHAAQLKNSNLAHLAQASGALRAAARMFDDVGETLAAAPPTSQVRAAMREWDRAAAESAHAGNLRDQAERDAAEKARRDHERHAARAADDAEHEEWKARQQGQGPAGS